MLIVVMIHLVQLVIKLYTLIAHRHDIELRTQNSELRNLFNIIHVFMCAITLPYLNTLGVLNT